ncbi:hypothetical protein EON79_19110 [bacterium]|nr:MAG: hypothetical protein EON79_19110 [bacterium]
MEPKPEGLRSVATDFAKFCALAGFVMGAAGFGSLVLLVISTGHQVQPGWEAGLFGLAYLLFWSGLVLSPILFFAAFILFVIAQFTKKGPRSPESNQ